MIIKLNDKVSVDLKDNLTKRTDIYFLTDVAVEAATKGSWSKGLFVTMKSLDVFYKKHFIIEADENSESSTEVVDLQKFKDLFEDYDEESKSGFKSISDYMADKANEAWQLIGVLKKNNE